MTSVHVDYLAQLLNS